jgi:hypothetical protein
VLKYVVGRSGDIEALKNHFVVPRGLIDLQDVASAVFRDVIDGGDMGSIQPKSNVLAAACRIGMPLVENIVYYNNDMFGKVNKKDQSKEERKQTERLLQYSAYDAYAAYQIAAKMYEMHPTESSLRMFRVQSTWW